MNAIRRNDVRIRIVTRVVALVWAALAGPALAAEIVQTHAVEGQVFVDGVNTNGVELKSPVAFSERFDRFDESLGTLTLIEYEWDYRFRVTIDVASVGGASGGASGPFRIDGTTVFSGGGGGNGGGSDVPGVLFADFSVTGTQGIDPAIAAAAQVLPFLGAPGQTVDLVYDAELKAQSTGDAAVSLELLDGSSVALRYLYAPEPVAALGGFASWLALAALARGRAR